MEKELENIKFKICFVSLNSYPLLKGINLGYIGGAETQQILLAKELKKRGYKISFITYGEKNKNIEIVDDIEIFPAYERNNLKYLPFFRKAIYIIRKMKNVNADIYFYRSGSPGIISIFGKLLQKKVIYMISSDAVVCGEAINKKDLLRILLGKLAHFFDIKLSDKVIVQNNFQKSKLKERFNVYGIIIKNSLDISLQFNKKSIGDYLLWVGTIRSIKQPELFLKLAEYFPIYNFIMIGGMGRDIKLFKQITEATKKFHNIKFLGFVDRDKIFDYYKNAILLVNTSKIEGFPNVFLESWLYSIPVVSLNVDPDGIISKYKLGFHSKTFDKMLDDTKTLLNDKELLETMGKNGRKYVEENHDIRKIADQYEDMMENLVTNHRGKYITKT